MGGARGTLKAKTIEELKQKVKEWKASAEASGFEDIRWGWDPERVEKTTDGYEIEVWAHT